MTSQIVLTSEQEKIIQSRDSIRINAVAGSGKTTTLIAYAASRPANARILYVAFNRSVRLEAQKKFAEQGLHNVQVETAHSLAYKAVVLRDGYRVESHNPYFLLKAVMGIYTAPSVEHLLLATHAYQLASLFCNSAAHKVEELSYLDTVHEAEEQEFVAQNEADIVLVARKYLAKMLKREISISHDFYLKLFQLQYPVLTFDYILFDEAQDASPVMVDIVRRQECATKVIVGDSHQQIYRWRYAVNSMEHFEYPAYYLSRSFRFGQPIADLAKAVIALKANLYGPSTVEITGQEYGGAKKGQRAIIGRTNISLLAEALNHLQKKPKSKIYFEGYISSYLFGEEGGSLSDILNIHLDKREFIKSDLYSEFHSVKEVDEFAKKSGDKPLQQVVDLVKKHGDTLPKKISSLWNAHVEKDARQEADTIFSTVHRCKGLEYDEVFLCNDFIHESSLSKMSDDKIAEDGPRLLEEINLLYVAITRARFTVQIPAAVIPEGFTSKRGSHIKTHSSESNFELLEKPKSRRRVKAEMAGSYWKSGDEQLLLTHFNSGMKIKDIAQQLKRSRSAIVKRLEKLQREGALH